VSRLSVLKTNEKHNIARERAAFYRLNQAVFVKPVIRLGRTETARDGPSLLPKLVLLNLSHPSQAETRLSLKPASRQCFCGSSGALRVSHFHLPLFLRR
jgi:hypothetical protein